MHLLESRKTVKEEIANAITHGLGAVLSIAGLIILIVFASLYGNAWHITGFTVFGVTLVLLYLSSTLYHSFTHPRIKYVFRKFDHMSIFLLIAGTYTPFCITILRGWLGWTLLTIVWICALTGVVLKAFHTGKKVILSTMLYIVLGWLVVFFIKPLYDSVSLTTFIMIMTGGALYTGGTYFFMKENIRYNHSIWHVFVLGGSIAHFFAVLTLLP